MSSICAGVVAELVERPRHRLVDELHGPAADELLRLDQRELGLDAGRVAVHHQPDRAGRRQHGRLRVAVPEPLAERDRLVPRLLRGGQHPLGHELGVDLVGRRAVLAHHAQHRVAVRLEPVERPHGLGDPCAGAVRLARHERGDGAGPGAAAVGVVREAARHQQRAEVRVAEPELPIGPRVRCRSSRSGSRTPPRGSPAR